jgi:glycyl-tRNA synthetase
MTLTFLIDAFDEEEVEGETRMVLRLHPRIAPITVAIFPLVKKDGMPERAHTLEEELRELGLTAFYDEKAAIGRRYRRQDEIGTPWCVTIDGETLEKGTVTVRERDSMQQVRIGEKEVGAYLIEARRAWRRSEQAPAG